MSDTLASLRRKIDGAGKLKSVVRTMKAVAASSIGQYEEAIRSLADYEHSVELGLSLCFRQKGFIAPSPVKRKPEGVVGAIVFGSDQGLVGKFNEMVVEFTEKTLANKPGEKRIWAVGERMHGGLADAGLPMVGRFSVPTSVEGITALVDQLQVAIETKSDKAVAEIYVFHAHPTTGALYEVVQQRLLPLDAQWQKGLAKIPWPTKNLPELFGHDEATLRAFVREYLFIVLFRACAESLASENASRLAAMQRAEKNIDSLSTDLNRSFYRLRQNSIDEELFDVIAGFNALSDKSPVSLP
jgi:F-type H+-transporting ATPase subunit gamma